MTWTATQFAATPAIAKQFVRKHGLTTEVINRYNNGTWGAVFHKYNRSAAVSPFLKSATECAQWLRHERDTYYATL